MSTLRVSNIEAKADASSPSVNEKVKVTNSSGDVLIHVNGETTGITTVGVNTTGKTFDVNANQKVSFAGVVTATSFVGNLTGDVTVATGATISGSTNTIISSTNGSERLRITSTGDVGINCTPHSNAGINLHIHGDNTTSEIRLTNTTTGTGANGSYIQQGGNTLYIGNSENGNTVFEVNGSERLRITSDGEVKMPSQPMMQVWAITTASKTVSGNSSTTLIPLNAGNTYDPLNDLDSSTGVYTIPVTGRYLTYYGTEGKTAANASAGSIYYNINNSGIAGQCLYYGEAYSGNSKQVILNLSAGDTIRWQLYGNNNNGYTVNAAVYGIHLLG